MTWALFTITLVITALVLLFCVDDLYIDIVALFKNLKPHEISERTLAKMNLMPQKKIAVMIANWHEDEILERMISGNTLRLDYSNYTFYLGVYPNDLPTLNVAKSIESKYSNVRVVVNRADGPTSKGQMLNQIVQTIRIHELQQEAAFDIFMLHDSEDLIHPLSLKLINYHMEDKDFLQIPVFSLPTSTLDFTRCTYIDEFAESHTKDMLVRSHLQGAVPSAGVGTAMSRLFVAEMLLLQHGELMKEDTLTEDYHLGIMAHRLGYSSAFLCFYRRLGKTKDYIATREYFPSNVRTSIRQKTRWTLGISLQGYKNLKWGKSFFENYFLWRDRRGLVNAPVLLMSYALFIGIAISYLITGKWPSYISQSSFLQSLFLINFTALMFKLAQRFRLVGNLNGFHTTPTIPIRWLLANYINCMAALHAVRTYRKFQKSGERPKWVKTTHELPSDFGILPENLERSV